MGGRGACSNAAHRKQSSLATDAMSRRRIAALLVLALDAYFVLRVAPEMGMIGPVLQLAGVAVGIGALGVLVLDLPFERAPRAAPQWRRGGESPAPNSLAQRVAGLVGLLLFVIAPLGIAARGAFLGALPSFVRPRGPEVSFAQSPGLFALHLLAYVAWGGTFLFLMLRGRAKTKSQQGHREGLGDRRS